jgi:hypothetical protein
VCLSLIVSSLFLAMQLSLTRSVLTRQRTIRFQFRTTVKEMCSSFRKEVIPIFLNDPLGRFRIPFFVVFILWLFYFISEPYDFKALAARDGPQNKRFGEIMSGLGLVCQNPPFVLSDKSVKQPLSFFLGPTGSKVFSLILLSIFGPQIDFIVLFGS